MGLNCFWNSANNDPYARVRLVDFEGTVVAGGRGTVQGRLEIWRDFKWGSVGPAGFDSTDATVACREMGHWGGVRYNDWETPQTHGERRRWVQNLRCHGEETRLEECNGEWGNVIPQANQRDTGLNCFVGEMNDP